MNIKVSGTDHKTSALDMRQRLYFSEDASRRIYEKIKKQKDIGGCIILSTCNRTEIFMSGAGVPPSDIIEDMGEMNGFSGSFHQYEGKSAVRYLIETACGLNSKIIGESQIIGQINSAAAFSRKNGASDCFLNKLFQTAVTAGKYVQTNVSLNPVPVSCAYAVSEKIKKEYGNIKGKRILIIGNGKVGKLMQQIFIQEGCEVWVTLREYKEGNNSVIKGCKTVAYSRRYETAENCDFVVSATKSPHFTITGEKLKKLRKIPDIIIDAAVPEDVEKNCRKLTKCFNTDDLGIETDIAPEKLGQVKKAVDRYMNDYEKWLNYKMSIGIMENIKEMIASRDDCDSYTVGKTADIVFGAMNDIITPEMLYKCSLKIRKGIRL